jgi:RNA polymerase primary sigma factor
MWHIETVTAVSFIEVKVLVMRNEEIVEQIQQGIDVFANQERLWNKNKPYVIKCIKKYIGMCDQQDFEDFVNEGFIGLVTAASEYKSDKGVSFLTYATYHIRSALYRYNGLNTYTVKVPEYLKIRIRKLATFKKEYREKYQREPSPEEIQKALCISGKSLRHLEKTIFNMKIISLDKYISEDNDTELVDVLSTDEKIEELVIKSQYQRELHEALEEALSILDNTTAMMIRCSYYQGNCYSFTALKFGCSRQNVHERIKKGFWKIIHSNHGKKLESFLYEGYHAKSNRLSDYANMNKIDEMGSEFLL